MYTRTKERSKHLVAALLMSAVLCLGLLCLAGCSSSGSTESSESSTSATQTSSSTQSDTSTEADSKTQATTDTQATSDTQATAETHEVKDMAGRTVEIPTNIERVATFGAVGVLNTMVECMGEGDTIINDMPASFTKNNKWAMQYEFAPQTKTAPVIETADGIDMEATLKAAPDVCLVMREDYAQQLEENGLAAIVIAWDGPADVKAAMELLGDVFNQEDRAQDYCDYFDATLKKADEKTATLQSTDRLTALYGDVATLTNPHSHISQWWIEEAGGDSATQASDSGDTLEYTMEELLSWQPQVIFSSNNDITDLTTDSQFADLPAVKDNRIYIVPTVGHVWGNRTVEQPLTVLWAMYKMYPDLYSESELHDDIYYFYDHFFDYQLSDDQIDKIINYTQAL